LQTEDTLCSWAAARAWPTPSAADDDVGCRACYGVVVACLSLLLFCVLAGTVGVVKACAGTGLAVALFGFVGWLAPHVVGTLGGASRAGGGGATAMLRARQAWGLVVAAEAVVVRVPPAFAYDCAAAAGAPCSVCLEDVRRGEAVRRMPPCGHLFHSACVDAWLHSHATCPMCRSDLLAPRNRPADKSVTAAAAADGGAAPPPHQSSTNNVLPPPV
jgi:hypothetical protein